MANSSDEDFSDLESSDEEIDLQALWRDRPFLSDDETEDELEIKDNDDNQIVVELTPMSSFVEKEEKPICPIQASLNEINNLCDRMTCGEHEAEQTINYASRLEAARQRVLSVGSPLAEEYPNLFCPHPTWTPPPRRPAMTAQTDREDIPPRPNQLRSYMFMRKSTTSIMTNRPQTNSIRITNPTWANRRQVSSQMNGPVNSNRNISFQRNNMLRSEQLRTLDTTKETEKQDSLPMCELLALFRPDNSKDKGSDSESTTSLSSDSSLSN